MRVAFGNYTTAQANRVLVQPEGGKLIRVTRVLVTAFGGTKFTLLSDPGLEPVVLTPPLHVSNGNAIDLRLGQAFALKVARGKALGVTTGFLMGAVEHSVVVWYEFVT